MSILVYAESWDGKFKKSTFEAVSYATQIGKQSNLPVTAVSIGNVNDEDLKSLGKYGANKVLSINAAALNTLNPKLHAQSIADAATKINASVVVLSFTYTGKAIAGMLAVKLKAGLVAGACALPSSITPFKVRKKCFSGKGLTDVEINSTIKIVGLYPNAYQLDTLNTDCAIEKTSASSVSTSYKVNETKKTSGKIVLTEAEIVVSAGRGMKAPENWGMIETLATELGAATACSKPVADVGWRPHHEHVGQTGITIAPNLYFAIGISGAIQHLAGVSSSKVIVAINSDAEAPFFKAADYGIVGDAFEIVPKLIEEVKKLKASN